jgi:hypothetical protein
MEPTRWLKRTAPGFDQLSTQERQAIKDFSLLWSLYEGTVLNAGGNADKIIHAVHSLKSQSKLTLEPFRAASLYFSDRYYDGADFTPEFDGLHLRASDHRALVEKVIRGQSTDDAEILSAILIIVLRLRNNLFHGIKWSYGIRGQLENFRNANNVLMSVITLHES